jgi:hypothetical protein
MYVRVVIFDVESVNKDSQPGWLRGRLDDSTLSALSALSHGGVYPTTKKIVLETRSRC